MATYLPSSRWAPLAFRWWAAPLRRTKWSRRVGIGLPTRRRDATGRRLSRAVKGVLRCGTDRRSTPLLLPRRSSIRPATAPLLPLCATKLARISSTGRTGESRWRSRLARRREPWWPASWRAFGRRLGLGGRATIRATEVTRGTVPTVALVASSRGDWRRANLLLHLRVLQVCLLLHSPRRHLRACTLCGGGGGGGGGGVGLPLLLEP